MKNQNEKRVLDAFANLIVVDGKVSQYVGTQSLSVDSLINTVAKSLKLEFEETKSILYSAIEKNPEQLANYFGKHFVKHSF